MRRVRVTVSMDADMYEYALGEARIRDLPIAEIFRWMLRDGKAFRDQLAERQAMYAKARAEYGW